MTDAKVKKSFPKDWGDISLFKFETSGEYWGIIDELLAEFMKNNCQEGFYCNREYIMDCYMDGHMYGLVVEETNAMYKRYACGDKAFCLGSGRMYMLPCFAIVEDGECKIVWVAKRVRRLGLGAKMMKSLKVKSAWSPLTESAGFWNSLGVPAREFKLPSD